MLVVLISVAILLFLPNGKAVPAQGRLQLLIVGGYASNPNELPYQVSIQYYGMHTCGGTIYSESYIITAAHCVDGDPVFAFTVIAGEHSLSKNDDTEQRRKVTKKIVHEAYVGSLYGNDIALLKLDKPLELNSAVQKLPVSPAGHRAKGTAVISGWGTLSPQGKSPDLLNQVEVSIFDDEKCQGSYGSDFVAKEMLCAGDPRGGKDSCRGDSGGPLVASDLGYKYLAGIVSWGISCALPDYPGVYTEVSYFSEWIKRNAV